MQHTLFKILTSPHSSNSALTAAKAASLMFAECIAILTCTSLVLIRSTLTCALSSILNTLAKKPWDILRLLLWTLMTVILSLIVTAVGRLGVLRAGDFDRSVRVRRMGCCDERTGSGTTIVPFPSGFLTFLMRIWIGGEAWMT